MCTYIVFIYTFLKIKILSDKIIQHLRGHDIQVYVSVDYVIAPIQDLSATPHIQALGIDDPGVKCTKLTTNRSF